MNLKKMSGSHEQTGHGMTNNSGDLRIRLIWALVLLPFFLWGLFAFLLGSWSVQVTFFMATGYVSAHMWAIVKAPKRWIALFCLMVFMVPLVSFFVMKPSHDRIWLPDVAQMPWADIDGDKVTIHNVRNFDYITENDFIPNYETRTYDLSQLRSADLLLSDWGLKYIAHTMVSFGFEDGRYLCFSIETRKEQGEEYSSVKGFFRQFELIYVVGDERDLVRLRTNFRQGEDVYLYRLKVASMDNVRNVLMEFIQRINHLNKHPQWYNALTENCMTSSYRLTRKHALPDRAKWHWSIILNGFSDRYTYENGLVDTSLPFEEFKQVSRINDRALSADGSSEFSKLIRQGLPGMDWNPETGG